MLVNKLKNTYPVLAQRNFRLFWIGQCISLIGNWIQATALQWLVYSMTKSAFLLGLLGVAQFGPMLLFSLVAGVLADRYPKKKLLIFTQSALMAQAFILSLLVWTDTATYELVLVLAACYGFINTLDMPTRQAIMPELVETEHIRNAINLNSAGVNVARMIGPAVAAYLMALYGTSLAFFINGLSFIPVLFLLTKISPIHLDVPSVRRKISREIMEGLRYVYHAAPLRYSVLAMLAVGVFIMNYTVFMPLYADEILKEGVYGYGLITSTIGAGSLTGAILVASFAKGKPTMRLLIGSGLALSASLIFLGLVCSFNIAITLCLILGFFHMLFITTANSMIQVNADPQFRGRSMSIYSLAFLGSTPIGNFFAGSVIEQIGTSPGMVLCGIITVILLLITVYTIPKGKHLF